nr:MAG TPA: hypothetical protein [Caudoviricetes sp.]
MSKAVMISIRPRWCELIASGEKTMEVRKTRPKLETPFKCYIYQTLPKSGDWNERDGRVIGEFVCDRIDAIKKRGIPENFDFCYLSPNEWGNDDIEVEIRDIAGSRIPKDALNEYGQNVPVLYAWHISDLRIYDEPVDITNFRNCNGCEYMGDCDTYCWKPMQRPPQSWCYVEEYMR